MDRLYASGCADYPDIPQCQQFLQGATFGPTHAIALIVLFAFLTKHLFSPSNLGAYYGPKFINLPENEQRRAGILHLGICIKIYSFTLLMSVIYSIVFQGRSWEDPGWPGIFGVTCAEMVSAAVMPFAALATFDLIALEGMKPIQVAHHLAEIAWILGALTMLLTRPAKETADALAQMILICKISVGWCLFSSIGSIFTRLTFLMRLLCDRSTQSNILLRGLLTGFAIFTATVPLELGLIGACIAAHWSEISTTALVMFGLAQGLFSATKVAACFRLWGVYTREREVMGRMRREQTPPPVVGGTAEKGMVGR